MKEFQAGYFIPANIQKISSGHFLKPQTDIDMALALCSANFSKNRCNQICSTCLFCISSRDISGQEDNDMLWLKTFRAFLESKEYLVANL